MVSTPIVGFAYVVTGTTLLFLLREPLEHPQRLGSWGFGVAVVGISLWPLSLGVNYFVTDLGASMGLWNLRLLAASLISVGWFTLAVSLTTGKRPSKRLLAPLAAYVAVGQAIAWSNPWHHLVLEPATTVQGTVLIPVDGPWFWVQAALNYGLIVGSTALLASEWARSTDVRRRQAGALALAVVPPILANLVTIFDVIETPHDLTPFGLIGSGLLLSWALYRVGFLDVVPIARNIAMANMRDAVVTLDSENRVIDWNRAAEELFDPPSNGTSLPAGEFFESIPDETLERFATVEETDTEFSVVIDGEKRHFSLSISPVTEGEETVGRVLVLHDITLMRRRERALKNREAQLDVLQQVLSRILRHNLRNKLGTIQGNAADIRENSDDAFARERSDSIVAASESLIEISEKAREIEGIINSENSSVVLDLRAVSERVVGVHRDAYPDVEFSVRGEKHRVRAIPALETAVSYLVENAAEYNDAGNPLVCVRIEQVDGSPRLTVRDNGPGIPERELESIQQNEETPLSHGSGIGLWIAKWAADSSGAEMAFETGEDGTVVSITFEESVGTG